MMAGRKGTGRGCPGGWCECLAAIQQHHISSHEQGFVSGFLLTFITTMRELSLIILLVTPATQLLAAQTMFYIENGDEQMANIVILILITITLIGNFTIGRFSKGGSLKKGLGM